MLQGMNPVNQKEVDQKMFDLDGSDNKGKLGANAILAVSMAACKVCLMHDSLPPSHRRANKPIIILLYHIMLSWSCCPSDAHFFQCEQGAMLCKAKDVL
jgi:hypothetical protein